MQSKIAAPPSTADRAARPRGCTNLKLRQLTRLVTRHYERFFANSGLRVTQYSLLAHVVRLAPLPCVELAAVMQLSASALSRNLQPLVAQGWIELSAGDDARSRLVSPTLAGLAQCEEAQRLWQRAQLALNDELGVERVQALHVLLDDCTARMGPLEGTADEP